LGLVLAAGTGARPDCRDLVKRWNLFAEDANRYVKGLDGGIVDAPLRARLPAEWAAVIRCECW
jgi:hypothetical protein